MYEVVQFELVNLASIESPEPLAHVIEESAQFLLVVGSDDRASSLPRGLVCARTVTRLRITHVSDRTLRGRVAAVVKKRHLPHARYWLLTTLCKEPASTTLRPMSMREPPRWDESMPKRRVYLVVLAAGLLIAAVCLTVLQVALARQKTDAAERLNAACQDNQARAYGASLRVRDSSVPEAAAIEAARVYVKEVRQTPGCFAAEVRSDVDAVEQAVKAGERPRPEYPKFSA